MNGEHDANFALGMDLPMFHEVTKYSALQHVKMMARPWILAAYTLVKYLPVEIRALPLSQNAILQPLSRRSAYVAGSSKILLMELVSGAMIANTLDMDWTSEFSLIIQLDGLKHE